MNNDIGLEFLLLLLGYVAREGPTRSVPHPQQSVLSSGPMTSSVSLPVFPYPSLACSAWAGRVPLPRALPRRWSAVRNVELMSSNI